MRTSVLMFVILSMLFCSCAWAKFQQPGAVSAGDSTETIARRILTLGAGERFGKGLAFSAAGAVPMPQERFGESYDQSHGYSFGYGFWYYSVPDTAVKSNWLFFVDRPGRRYLEASWDVFTLDDAVVNELNEGNAATASVLSFHLCNSECVPISLSRGLELSPVWGHKVGISWFFIREDEFRRFGQTTLTELGRENRRGQLGTGRQMGVLLTGLDPVAIEYNYDLMSVERTWKFGHSLLSVICGGLLVDGVAQLGRELLSPEAEPSTPVEVILMAYQMAASYYWYDLTYKHNNWPFNDEPPLHYEKHLVALHYKF